MTGLWSWFRGLLSRSPATTPAQPAVSSAPSASSGHGTLPVVPPTLGDTLTYSRHDDPCAGRHTGGDFCGDGASYDGGGDGGGGDGGGGSD